MPDKNTELPGKDQAMTAGRDVFGTAQVEGSYNTVNITVYQTLTPAEAPASDDLKETTSDIGPNPYKGLGAFTEDDAEDFFGRENLVERLRDRFHSFVEGAGDLETAPRILPILGPSGSGKSSLVRAGLIPALDGRPLSGVASVHVAVMMPGSRPLESLARVLAYIATGERVAVRKEREFERDLRESDFDGLRRIAGAIVGASGSHLVVFVDQFEETYSLCEDPDVRQAFIANLMDAAADPDRHLSVVLTLRSDFLGETQAHHDLNAAIAAQGVIVPAMGAVELERAIAEPARRRGHPIDDGTVHLLIEGVEGRQGTLPLLQFALERIWEGMAAGADPAVTLKEIGGVGGAMAAKARALYENLGEPERKIAKRAFLRMVRLGEGTLDTRRRARLSDIVAAGETQRAVRHVIDRFAKQNQRLVSVSSDPEDGVVVELTHEALLEHRSDLHDWLEEDRDGIRFHRRLEDAARQWGQAGRPDGLLWRPPNLDLLQTYAARPENTLTDIQADFLRVSSRKDSLGRATKIVAMGAIAALAVIATGLALYAFDKQAETARQLVEIKRNESLMLAGLSRAQTKEADAVTGALLALRGLPRESKGGEFPFLLPTYAALYNALHTQREQIVFPGHEGAVLHAGFSPDGTRVVTASSDGTARLWDASGGAALAVLQGHDDIVLHAGFSPDGTRVVTASSDGTARLWDASGGAALAVLQGHDSLVRHAGFSPDGTRVVTASDDGTARLWDASGGAALAVLRGHDDSVWHAGFSPDGTRVVTASRDRTARLWDASGGAALAVLQGHDSLVQHAGFSPDGTRVVTASDDGTARLWDASGGAALAVLRGHDATVWHAGFSPDGTRVVTASFDGTARLWDASGVAALAVLQGHDDTVWHAGFSPDGTRVVTASWDGTARLWDASGGAALAVLQGHAGWVQHAGFSPDGTRVVTASEDGTARLWEIFPYGMELVGFAEDVLPRKLSRCQEIAFFLRQNDGLTVCR